jgi:hypothetical protein
MSSNSNKMASIDVQVVGMYLKLWLAPTPWNMQEPFEFVLLTILEVTNFLI